MSKASRASGRMVTSSPVPNKPRSILSQDSIAAGVRRDERERPEFAPIDFEHKPRPVEPEIADQGGSGEISLDAGMIETTPARENSARGVGKFKSLDVLVMDSIERLEIPSLRPKLRDVVGSSPSEYLR